MAEIRYKGVVRNSVIVPIGEFPLPDGTVVDITVAEDEAWRQLVKAFRRIGCALLLRQARLRHRQLETLTGGDAQWRKRSGKF